MKAMLFLSLFLIPFFVFSQQDTTMFFGVNGRIADGSDWKIKKEIKARSNKRNKVKTIKAGEEKENVLYVEKIKVVDKSTFKIKVKGSVFSNAIIRKFEEENEGKFEFSDFQDGILKRTGTTLRKFPLLLDGKVEEFFDNGNKKSVSVYKNNELVSNKNWLENGDPYIDNIFYSVDKEPLFDDGMGRLHQHILKTFNNSGLDLSQVSGIIKVGFVVMENGRIDGIRIEEGMNSTLNNLVLNAFKTLLGEWTPAELNGQKVRCFQLFPINFIYRDYNYDYVDLRGGMLYWEIN